MNIYNNASSWSNKGELSMKIQLGDNDRINVKYKGDIFG